MFNKSAIVFVLFLNFVKLFSLKVPAGFKFGVATASYQIEGGWNASGKGESIWDRLTHEHPEIIKDQSTGDIACDSYHLWKDDIQILKNMGVDFYRFSLSWPRILPEGFSNKVNSDGVRYYSDLINELIKNGIEPMVTLFHWDLPQPMQDLGGWTNYLTADYFADYARVVFTLFGDRVKTWITINEPASICVAVYEENNGAPDVVSPGIGSYICGKAILLAHAQAYKIYEREFKEIQHGKVGITVDSIWAEPLTNETKNLEAADREMQMSFGWYTHPIFSKSGDYPEVMKTRIANFSARQNFSRSRLPGFSTDEIKLLRGSADFLGLNHYHTLLAIDQEYDIDKISFKADKGTFLETNPNWKPSPDIVPWGFRKLINWVKNQYNNPLVYITENGIGDTTGTLDDTDRVTFIKEYLNAVLNSVTEDDCNVSRYTVWSLMDNMEWEDGYTIKYGLYNVDFKDRERKRTPKKSAEYYKNIIKNRRTDE